MVEFPSIVSKPGRSNRKMRHVGAHRASFPFLPNDFPNGNGKFVIAEHGCKFCESPLLSERGDIVRQRGHRTRRCRMPMRR